MNFRQILKHPLLWAIGWVALLVILLHFVSDNQNSTWVVPSILTALSISYAMAALSMAIRTRIRFWSILGAGLLMTFLGDAIWWFSYLMFTQDNQWFFDHRRNIVILVEAMFSVGSVYVVLGLIHEWLQDRNNRALASGQWSEKRDEDSTDGPNFSL